MVVANFSPPTVRLRTWGDTLTLLNRDPLLDPASKVASVREGLSGSCVDPKECCDRRESLLPKKPVAVVQTRLTITLHHMSPSRITGVRLKHLAGLS